MDFSNTTLIIPDSTFFSNATLKIFSAYIDTENLIRQHKLLNEKNPWINLLDEIIGEVGAKGLVTEAVMVESGMIDADGT